MHVCIWYTELTCISYGTSEMDIVDKVLCVCVCVCVCVLACVCACMRACMCLCGWGWDYRPYACMLVCVWYTELTCIPYWASRMDIVGQVLSPSVCRQMAGPLPLPGALSHYGRYLPWGPTICILCAYGESFPLLDALNHWVRYVPQGPTMCILWAYGGVNPIAGRP